MMPALDKLLICPFCKGEKPILQLMSGNTFGASIRSDLKTDYPMLPQPSPVQRCPHCGKYYFTYAVDSKEGTSETFEKGELTYEEITEALLQLEKENLSVKDEISLRLLFIQIYNTTYQLLWEKDQPVPTSEEQMRFRQQVERLLSIWDVEAIAKAEFMREIGQFDECLRTLDAAKINDPRKDNIAQRIRALANEKSTKVFMI
jgi:hypothetical protein